MCLSTSGNYTHVETYDGYARPVIILEGFIAVQITADRTNVDFENAGTVEKNSSTIRYVLWQVSNLRLCDAGALL